MTCTYGREQAQTGAEAGRHTAGRHPPQHWKHLNFLGGGWRREDRVYADVILAVMTLRE